MPDELAAQDVSPIERLLYEGPISTSILREFAVWCAMRVWHLVDAAADDLGVQGRLRYARALNVARREAYGRADAADLLVAWVGALDQRAAKTAWWPQRLASRGALRAAARMGARFACRATCHADTATAAASTSWYAAWSMAYLAAGLAAQELQLAATERHGKASERQRWLMTLHRGLRLADQVMRVEQAEHARELRRRIGWSRPAQSDHTHRAARDS